MEQKKIVTIQDISCFGKCSLTVALPIISAMGIGCAIIPTAVLSTHTGGFKGYTFKDLTDEIQKISDHWQSEGLSFDGIYTGYLGSKEQIRLVSDFFDRYKTDSNIIFVDPAMADNGKLYPGFGDDFPAGMASLCAKADYIDPNMTEATLMLGEEYPGDNYDMDYVRSILKKLCALGCKTAILTGVKQGDKQGAVAYDSVNDKYYEYFSENLPMSCHGTGDVFSSALMGALTLGKDMTEALSIAVDYTVDCMKLTYGDETHWYGVKFEQGIKKLVNRL